MDKISIVIIARNEGAVIGSCLHHVFTECYRHGGDTEVIVVDNGSTDKTAVIARRASAKVINEPTRGLTRARNAGLRAATGDIVAFIDADNRMPDGWLNWVTREFDGVNVVAVSGPYHYYDLPWYDNAMVTAFNAITWALAKLGFPMLQGGNFAARRWAMDSIGGFDESIEFYGDDTDVARRIAKLGIIRWRWGIYMGSSGRRLAAEGTLRIGIRYALNWASVLWRGVPATHVHKDIRTKG